MKPILKLFLFVAALAAFTELTAKAAFPWDAVGAQSRTIFVGTTDGILCTNTALEKSIVPTGWGTNSVIKNTWAVGKNLKIHMSGIMRTVTNTTLTVKLKLGTTLLASSGAITLDPLGYTNTMWRLEADVTCRTIGATGTFAANGLLTFYDSGTNTLAQIAPIFNTLPTAQTVDTTATKAIDVTAQYNLATNDAGISTSLLTQTCVMEMSR